MLQCIPMQGEFAIYLVDFVFKAFFGLAQVSRMQTAGDVRFFGRIRRQERGGDTETAIFGAVFTAFIKVF